MNTPEVKEHIWALIAKCRAGECSKEENDELSSWRHLSPENNALFTEAVSIFTDTANALWAAGLEKDKAFDGISKKTEVNDNRSKIKTRKDRRLSLIFRVAASVILLVSISLAYFYYANHTAATVIATTADEIRHISLPDGSVAELNGHTKITYIENFSSGKRAVNLSGEAFFNITPDSKHPFVIYAGAIKVKVIGTAFNVKAYKEQNNASVVVESGTVRVSSENRSVTITKGETALFNKNNGTLKSYKNNDVNYKSWKTKQIRFVNTSLKDAFTTLENVYDINIDVENTNIIKNKKINADFNRQSPEFVLKTICETYHLSYIKNGNNYLITGKK
jgi:ferric-dicitrate binding protein FerR (iron transport regulator)